MKNNTSFQRLKSQFSRLLLSCILILASNFSSNAQQAKPLTRIEFVFDASFSMFGQWQSGMKMDIAKKMLSEFLDSIQKVDNSNLEIAFRCYGHQVPLRPERSCTDTKLEVPFGKNNATAIKNKLKQIVPKGTTPIAYTLEQSLCCIISATKKRNHIKTICNWNWFGSKLYEFIWMCR